MWVHWKPVSRPVDPERTGASYGRVCSQTRWSEKVISFVLSATCSQCNSEEFTDVDTATRRARVSCLATPMVLSVVPKHFCCAVSLGSVPASSRTMTGLSRAVAGRLFCVDADGEG